LSQIIPSNLIMEFRMRPAALPDRTQIPHDHACHECPAAEKAVCRVLECGDLMRLRSAGFTHRVAAGQPLFHEGDPAGQVYNVTSGALKLYKLLPDGRRQVTGFAFAGDFLGLTMDDEHAFTAEALEDTQLCRFPRGRFDSFADDSMDMERELYRRAARELSAAQAQMVLLGRKTAEERLASFFLDLLGRERDGAGVIDLPMSRSDIADYLGLTKETVSRVLALLKRKRIVRLQAMNRIEVLDPEGLRFIADGLAEA
jgi:CRP/FNR family transcriptional regulator, anaerobic regulatory protein